MSLREKSPFRIVVGLVVVLAIALTSVSAVAATKKKKPAPKPKPKPVCNLVVDPATDGPPTGDASLNIVSADVATNATTITAVIRVQKLSDPDLMAPQGRFYELQFTGTSQQIGVPIYAMLSPAGNTFEGGAGTGVVDVAKNEIRISVPLSHWTGAGSVVPGPPFHDFIVYADISNGAEPIPTTFTTLGDTATSKATYQPGTPSCVAVGK